MSSFPSAVNARSGKRLQWSPAIQGGNLSTIKAHKSSQLLISTTSSPTLVNLLSWVMRYIKYTHRCKHQMVLRRQMSPVSTPWKTPASASALARRPLVFLQFVPIVIWSSTIFATAVQQSLPQSCTHPSHRTGIGGFALEELDVKVLWRPQAGFPYPICHMQVCLLKWLLKPIHPPLKLFKVVVQMGHGCGCDKANEQESRVTWNPFVMIHVSCVFLPSLHFDFVADNMQYGQSWSVMKSQSSVTWGNV